MKSAVKKATVLAFLVLGSWPSLQAKGLKSLKQGDFTVSKIQVSCDDGMHVKTKSKTASFNKNVDLKLDSFRLTCQRLVIHYSELEGKEAAIESMEASGGVKITDDVRQIFAESERLTYDKTSSWMVLESSLKTKVRQGENYMEARSIKINVLTSEMLVLGRGSLEININDL